MPTPSAVVADAVGTPSVAEAAALLAAGPGAELVVHKQANAVATVAVARRAGPPGRLRIVGLGPGAAALRTPAAETAVRHAQVVIGYGPYVEACADLLQPAPGGRPQPDRRGGRAGQAGARRSGRRTRGRARVLGRCRRVRHGVDHARARRRRPRRRDRDRSRRDRRPRRGRRGGRATRPRLRDDQPVRPPHAVGSDRGAAARGGRRRLRAWRCTTRARAAGRGSSTPPAGSSSSTARPSTPVGVVTDATRAGEHVEVTTLAELDPAEVGMTTCVLIGASTTRVVDGRVVTPRGYQP